MRLFNTRDRLRGAAVTACGAAIGLLLMWLLPYGCYLRGNPASYRWTCMFPGLLLSISLVAAVLLPICGMLRDKFSWCPPGTLIMTMLLVGIATQFILVALYLGALNPAYRVAFLKDALLIPQPFIAGACAGLLYAVGVRWKTAA